MKNTTFTGSTACIVLFTVYLFSSLIVRALYLVSICTLTNVPTGLHLRNVINQIAFYQYLCDKCVLHPFPLPILSLEHNRSVYCHFVKGHYWWFIFCINLPNLPTAIMIILHCTSTMHKPRANYHRSILFTIFILIKFYGHITL